MSKKTTELSVADDFLGELISKYEKLSGDLEKSKKEILENARLEALKIVTDANKTIERTVKEIKEANAEKERTKTARTSVKELKQKLETTPQPQTPNPQSLITDSQPPTPNPQSPSPKPSFVPLSKLQLNEPLPVKHRQFQSYVDDLQRKLYDFQMTLDLRGKRVDEAVSMLQHYIDDAVMLSINEVRILHGKGNGVLRQITRDYLRSVKEIKTAKDELVERGGSGITVVTFK